jgi:hypothetical protein
LAAEAAAAAAATAAAAAAAASKQQAAAAVELPTTMTDGTDSTRLDSNTAGGFSLVSMIVINHHRRLR